MDKIAVIGAGLAGSILAYTLQKRGYDVEIFDCPALPSSSQVSAGILNPITGRRLVKTWLADELFLLASPFYTKLGKDFGCTFFHPTSVYKPYQTIEEQNFFSSQFSRQGLENYGTSIFSPLYKNLVNPMGGILIEKGGWIDVPLLLEKIKSYFIYNERFNFIEAIKNDFYSSEYYKELFQRFKYVLCCEGFYATQNPLWKNLPFQGVKGEIIEIEFEDNPKFEHIINQNCFILPQKKTYKVGSTYHWFDLNWNTTTEGVQELEEKLIKLVKIPYKIIKTTAGIRPATLYRRPFIGWHPQHKNIGIFNGFGSKGGSLIPYFAEKFCNFIAHNDDLPPEVKIEKYYG